MPLQEPYPCQHCGGIYKPDPEDPWTSCDYCGWFQHNRCYPASYWQDPTLRIENQVVSGNHRLVCHGCARARATDLYSLCGSSFDTLCGLGKSTLATGLSSLATVFGGRAFQGGVFRAVHASVDTCRHLAEQIEHRKPRLLTLIGNSGVGKSTVLDSLCPALPHSSLLGEMQRPPDKTKAILEGLMGIKIRDNVNPIEPLIPEDPCDLDMQTGRLKAAVAQDYASCKLRRVNHMIEGFVDGRQMKPSKCVSSVLPRYNEESESTVTTSQAIVVFLDTRHSMTYCLMTEYQVVEVARSIKKSIAIGTAATSVKSVESFCQAVFGRSASNLAKVQDVDLISSIVPSMRDKCGRILQIKLPGTHFEDERLYLHATLVKLAEGNHLEDWYHLVWLVTRGLPSGLLPAQDGLADIPGQDGNPIHGCIRGWVLGRADGAILVLDSKQQFQGSGGNPLRSSNAPGLLQRIADNTFSLAIVLTDMTQRCIQDFVGDEWTDMEALMKKREGDCSEFMRAQLKPLNDDLADSLVKNMHVVHFFAPQSLGLLAALQQSRLPASPGADQQKWIATLLQRTGAPKLYAALLAVCQDDIIQSSEQFQWELAKLEQLREVIMSRAPLGVDEERIQAAQLAVKSLKELFNTRSLPSVFETEQDEVMGNCKNVWEHALGEVSVALQRFTSPVEDHHQELLQLRDAADMTQHGTRASHSSRLQSALISQYKPLLEWHEALASQHVKPLLSLAKQDLQHRLQVAAEHQGTFCEEPQKLLIDIWKEHIIPIVLSELSHRSDLLKDLKLAFCMGTRGHLKDQLEQFIRECEAGQHQEEGLWEALERKFRAAWRAFVSDRKCSETLQKWVESIVAEVTTAFVGDAQARHLLTLMARDLNCLSDHEWVEKADKCFRYLIGPPNDTHQSLLAEAEMGATNLAELMVLINSYQRLLMRYEVIELRLYDSYDAALEKQAPWYEGRSVRLEASEPLHQTSWLDDEKLPAVFAASAFADQALHGPGATSLEVDLYQLAGQLSSKVLGVANQDVRMDCPEQQTNAVKELLERELVQSAIEGLNNKTSNRAHFPAHVFGLSGHKMLSKKSWQQNPWHAVCCVILLTGNDVEVKLVKAPSHGHRPVRKRARPSSVYVTIRAPQSNHDQLPSSASSASAPSLQLRPRRLTQIALICNEDTKRWEFQVYSSRVLSHQSGKLQLLRVGMEAAGDRQVQGLPLLEDDKTYQYCRICWSKDGFVVNDKSFDCYRCAGDNCAYAVCKACATTGLSLIEQLRLQNPEWLCVTCNERGRQPSASTA